MIVTGIYIILYLYAAQGNKPYGTVIGIDLGTTYSCVGIPHFGRIEILGNDMGRRITPSFVSFTVEGELVIGDAAHNQMVRNPENTIYDAKRFIGRTYDDPVVQGDIKNWPFKVINQKNKPYVSVNMDGTQKFLSAEEISGMVLSKMKRIAEEFLGESVTHAVITVPAYFHDAQRQATKDAAAIARLKVLRIINEPTAAALAYGIDRLHEEKTILVFDLGGGTFDVTLFKIQKETVTVLATSGDLHLGGQDFNQNIVDYFLQVYQKKTGKDVSGDKRAVQKLRVEVEQAKRELSTRYQAKIVVDHFSEGDDFSEILTRAKLEDLNKKLFEKTRIPLEKVLAETNIRKEDIDEVLLVGGSTRIPKIQELVRTFFNEKELSKGINPDEAVAYGATVLAGYLSGAEKGEKLIIDVIPHSIGVQMIGDRYSIILPLNSEIPVNGIGLFTTVFDNQEEVEVNIYEGENTVASYNRLIGEFTLEGIELAKAGIPEFEVTMDIDDNGILTVTAKDRVTKVQKTITVKYNEHRMSYEELEQLKANQDHWIQQEIDYQKRYKHVDL